MKLCPYCETGYHDSFMTCPTHGGMLSEIRDLRPGMLVRGTYRIVRKLGKGGMGSVYLAEQTLLNEPRALKFLSQDLSEDEDFTARFLREVRTLRQVRNKNVVDCGDPERAEDGTLFYSMEFVDGPNLRDYLKTADRPFDVGLALELTRGIAEGMGAAHSRGLVHRDIKPENVLLARENGRFVPKIADFGIVATKESAHQTRTGSMMLTMAYASPEQWIGTRAAELDGRTDIYALGGVLFEMLTGQTLFEAENYHQWAQLHMHSPALPPSKYRPRLTCWRGLDAMVLRMLAKKREDRQQNVEELLREMDAIVYDPGAAAAPGAHEAATVLFRETAPLPVAPLPEAALTSAETVLTGPVPARTQPVLAARPAAQPPAQTAPMQNAPAQTGPAPVGVDNAEPVEPVVAPPSVITFRQKEPTAGAEESPTLTRPIRRATVESRPTAGIRTTARTTGRTTGRIVAPGVEESAPEKKKSGAGRMVALVLLLAAIAAGYFAWQKYGAPKERYVALDRQTDAIVSVAYAFNGFSLASASRDGSIQLWDTTENKATGAFKAYAEAVSFAPDGRSVASANDDGTVKLWDVAGGQQVATLAGHTDKVLAVAFSPDGRMLASGGADMTVRLWDVAGDKLIRTLTGSTGEVRAVAFSPDGRTLATGGGDTMVRLWDAATGNPLRALAGHSRAVNAVAWSADGRTLASGSDDTSVRLWNASNGALAKTLAGHTDGVKAVAFSRDGRSLLSGSSDGTARLWDVTAGTQTGLLNPGAGAMLTAALSPDGHLAATAGADHLVRVWDLSALVK